MKSLKSAIVVMPFLLSFQIASATDHSQFITGPFKSGEEVTRACLQCHEKQAEDFMKTAHWKWKGIPNSIKGMEKSKNEYGKANLINNFCISIEGKNQEFCTKCHAGYGWRDNTFNFNDKTKIDCLVCHTRDKNYKKALAGEPDKNLIEKGVLSLTKAAQNVGKPTRDNCGVCHFYGGGGDAVKHGDLDSTLSKPSRNLDVHMGGMADMQCTDCHVTKNHKIPGILTFVATHEGRVHCEDCHKEPHKDSSYNKILSKHTKTVACQTCHIPYFARGQATKMHWDWSTVGKDIESEKQFGKETYAKHKGSFVWAMNVVPTYEWFSGKIERYLKGQKVPQTANKVYLSKPVGSINDKNSKIYPFKIHTGKQPIDAVYRYLLVPQLYKGLWSHYDWEKALQEGAKAANLPFSGNFEFIETAYYDLITHQVAPKEQSLKCNDCHFGGKRLDWKALGYKGDPIRYGSRKVK